MQWILVISTLRELPSHMTANWGRNSETWLWKAADYFPYYHNHPSVVNAMTKIVEDVDVEECNFWNFRRSLILILDQVKTTSVCAIHIELPACRPRDHSLQQYRNMAIWNLCNIDIPQSLNWHHSFPKRKFENRAQNSCRQGPILSQSTISFELHFKMAEIDVEKCSFWSSKFQNFRSPVTLTLILDWVKVISTCTIRVVLPARPTIWL